MPKLYKYRIGLWSGVGILSLINIIMILKHAAQTPGALLYNEILFGISIIGMIYLIIIKKKEIKNE